MQRPFIRGVVCENVARNFGRVFVEATIRRMNLCPDVTIVYWPIYRHRSSWADGRTGANGNWLERFGTGESDRAAMKKQALPAADDYLLGRLAQS